MDRDDDQECSDADVGQVTVEYVLLMAFIALAVALAVFVLGNTVLGFIDKGVELPWEGISD